MPEQPEKIRVRVVGFHISQALTHRFANPDFAASPVRGWQGIRGCRGGPTGSTPLVIATTCASGVAEELFFRGVLSTPRQAGAIRWQSRPLQPAPGRC